jgi:LPS-assembly protein
LLLALAGPTAAATGTAAAALAATSTTTAAATPMAKRQAPLSCRPANWHPPAEGLRLSPRSAAEATLLSFEADRLEGTIGSQLRASGRVQVERGNMAMQADELEYGLGDDRVRARGDVQLLRGEDRFAGSELDVDTGRSTGYVLKPRFHFALTDAGGRAERIDFLGPNRMEVSGSSYSSCKVGDDETPPWVLTARRIRLDFNANEGIAEGAVLRFQDVPILALPVLSFPVTEDRKSGWLPPSIDLSTSNGLVVAVPYYWNIAPNYDATLTPTISLKRGAGLDSEFRYLQPGFSGESALAWLPHDQVASRDRWAARWDHRGQLGSDVDVEGHLLRVSDDAYWNDGLGGATNLTPRLLGSQAKLQQRRRLRLGEAGDVDQWLYAQAQSWQVMQSSDSSGAITAPYRRLPQVGARWAGLGSELEWSLQAELNRFGHADSSQTTGSRAHLLGALAWRLGDGGWQLTPRMRFNAAAYDMDQPMSDGRSRASRFIPTFSLDSSWTFDRPLTLFGRALTQTLEPRLLYVQTPWRDQSTLPNFDSAALDFNATTVFHDAAFSGVDRVADTQGVTAGLTTRFIDAGNGVELARLGVAQRYLLRDQLITSDGVPLTQRFSDVLLLGSTSAIPRWSLGSTLQYNPEISRVTRSTGTVTYSPGPFRTLHASYSFQRNASEQYALGWQWPVMGRGAPVSLPVGAAAEANAALRAAGASGSGGQGGSCEGTLYTVGRIDYSKRDRRVSGALAGFEYDAGCWIGRVVVERRSTGASAATSHLMLQLELVGLSRLALGSNPLSTLKDNIPGYRLLRERGSAAGTTSTSGGDSGSTEP